MIECPFLSSRHPLQGVVSFWFSSCYCLPFLPGATSGQSWLLPITYQLFITSTLAWESPAHHLPSQSLPHPQPHPSETLSLIVETDMWAAPFGSSRKEQRSLETSQQWWGQSRLMKDKQQFAQEEGRDGRPWGGYVGRLVDPLVQKVVGLVWTRYMTSLFS